jgi:proteic killer suppression protein
MILGFKDKRTELFAKGEFVRAFQGFDRQAWKRLEILDAKPSPTLQAFQAIASRP